VYRVDIANHKLTRMLATVPVPNGLDLVAGRGAFAIGDFTHQYLVSLNGRERALLPVGWHTVCGLGDQFVIANGSVLALASWTPGTGNAEITHFADIDAGNVYDGSCPT
jgi:hypothetical protein